MLPVASTDLVLDQRVLRGPVGHAQQGFGHDHEGETLLGGQTVVA